jgi:hypothetical protein
MRGAWAAAMGIALFAAYVTPVAFNLALRRETFVRVVSTDTVPTSLLAASLVKDGDVYLDEYRSYFEYRFGAAPSFVRVTKARLVSVYPVVTALLALPVFAVPVWLGWAGWVGAPEDTFYVARVAAAALTAAAMGLFFLTCTELLPTRKAAAVTLAIALGTSVWTTASQGLWQHTGSVLLLCGALLCLVWGERRPALVAWSGMLLAGAAAARYNVATTAAALGGYVLLRHRAAIFAFLALGAVPTSGLLTYNTVVYGAPREPGYGGGVGPGWNEVWWQGFIGLLASPAKGFFVYSPVLVLAIPEGVRAVSRPWSLPFYAAAGWMAFVAVMSGWWGWYGGVSYGNRMLTDIVPLAGILLARACARWSRGGWWLFGALSVASVGIQALGLLDYGAFWHRVYDAPAYWDRWIWDVGISPIPFYTARYAGRLLGLGAIPAP